MNPNDPQELESAIHEALRALPPRKAPATLEGRVLAELSRRAALPWWRRSFAHWPQWVRALFLVLSVAAGVALAAVLAGIGRSRGVQSVAGEISAAFAWAGVVRDLIVAADERVRLWVSSIRPIWLYSVVGGVGACYAALAAIGLATYRALSPSGRAT